MRKLTLPKAPQIGILLAVALATAVIGNASAMSPIRAQASNDHRIIAGIASTWTYCESWGAYAYWCWHNDEIGQQVSALDLDLGAGVSGTPVYHQEYGITGSVYAYVQNDNSACTGFYVKLYDGNTYAYLGEEHYLHIVTNPSIDGMGFYMNQGWTVAYLGTIAASQPGCSWTGPHVHQSTNNSAGTASYTNWCIVVPPDVPGCLSGQRTSYAKLLIEPTGDYTYNWVHRLSW